MNYRGITLSRAWAGLLLLVAAAPLHAQTERGAVFYSDALVAMRGEDYGAALKLFAKAQQAGLDSATLHYNRGVAYYKLGDYQHAKGEFLKAEPGSESAPLVHYNLGLTTYRMGQTGEARQWFAKVSNETSNQQLTDLADDMVARIDEKSPVESKPAETERSWRLSADLLYGHDDNVTLENSDLSTSTRLKDSYLDLYAALRYQISGDTERGYWGQLSASSLQYHQYGNYDYTQYDAGLFRDGRYGALDTRAGLRVSRSYIGGNDYLQKYMARVQADYPLDELQTLRLRYDLSRYDPVDSNYDYLAGLKGALNLESLWRIGGRKYTIGYELENNSRDDYSSGANFISYSATRQEFSASVSLPVAASWQITFGGDYRRSRYNDADIINGVSTSRRQDDRWRTNISAEYRLTPQFDLVGEYHYTNNDSNFVVRRYQRNQYSLGVRGYF